MSYLRCKCHLHAHGAAIGQGGQQLKMGRESQGQGSLVGCRLWGCTESDTTEATQQQQQQHGSSKCKFFCVCLCAKLLQSSPALCDPMNMPLPGSSVHGILQARILEWAAMPSASGSSRPRDRTCVSYVYLHWQAGSLPLASPGKLTRCRNSL